MSDRPSIVVLTPLKNDAWILRRFLEVTTVFADRILIADQGSTDGGLEICRQFAKVTVIDNSASDYDETSRQQLLLSTARALVPQHRILMALDADEILAANAPGSQGWQRLLAAAPGTIVLFEKPNLYLSPFNCERRPPDFPGAFVDDGSPHRAQRIHSPRLPMPDGAPRLVLDDVKVLHYALVRPEAQKAKFRMYAALENVMRTKSLYWRRRYYWSGRVLQAAGPVEPTPREWFMNWESLGIDMTSVEDVQPYWQDLATLDLLLQHGSRRFWLDDLWEKDWSRFQREQARPGKLIPSPQAVTTLLQAGQRLLESLAGATRRLRRPHRTTK
ncbi:MAG: glycosyltransferase family 2 protein [Thermoanaerobaculia bacterium]